MKRLLAGILVGCFGFLMAEEKIAEIPDGNKIETVKNEIKKEAKKEKKKRRFAVSLKQGYFIPQDSVLRDIFDNDGASGGYWVEGAFRYTFWKGLTAELNGSYFSHKGCALVWTDCTTSSTACCTSCCTSCCNSCCNSCCSPCGSSCCAGEKTKYKLPTLGLGLKYFFDLDTCCEKKYCDRLSFFLGGGLKVFFLRIDNYSPYVRQCESKNVAGGYLGFGALIKVGKGFFIELFGDYLGRKIKADCCNTCCYPCNTNCCSSCSTNCCYPCCSPCGTSCYSSCCSSCGTSCSSCFSSCGTCCYTDCCTTTTVCCGSCVGCDLKVGGFVVGVGLGFSF